MLFGSGSGRISHLLSGIIWFRLDTIIAIRCIPTHYVDASIIPIRVLLHVTVYAVTTTGTFWFFQTLFLELLPKENLPLSFLHCHFSDATWMSQFLLAALSGNNIRQVVHTHVPLSSSRVFVVSQREMVTG